MKGSRDGLAGAVVHVSTSDFGPRSPLFEPQLVHCDLEQVTFLHSLGNDMKLIVSVSRSLTSRPLKQNFDTRLLIVLTQRSKQSIGCDTLVLTAGQPDQGLVINSLAGRLSINSAGTQYLILSPRYQA